MNQLLEVKKLSKKYGDERVLSNLYFSLYEGEKVGIVGQSGSGKSTLARCLLQLETFQEGSVSFTSKQIDSKKKYEKIQIIFQNPHTSINPRWPVWKIVSEPYRNYVHSRSKLFWKKDEQLLKKVADWLSLVQLPEHVLNCYPHELSGGQKQRVQIARALTVHPALLICDEPTASLDATTQLEILHLLKSISKEQRMAMLFISHDIAAVQFICDRILVLKEGHLVDDFTVEELFSANRHPYTKKLIQYSC